MDNNLNKGISCNVKRCVFNELGQGCNLDKVSISQGTGEHHFCKSFIPLDNEDVQESTTSNNIDNTESSKESYIDFGELISDIEEKFED